MNDWSNLAAIDVMEAGTGIKRIRNEEIAEAAAANSDVMIAFASIDPHKGNALKLLFGAGT